MQPELFSQRSAGAQVVTGVVVPAAFGLVTGIVLGVSGAGYLLLSLLAVAGGVLAGFEHRAGEEGLVRGVTGGLLFGSFILFAHAFIGGKAKTNLPSPEILLVLITTVVGGLLGALGGWRRGRRAAQPQT
ncbi:MAG: hypothetical protein ACJ766_14750 [Thermoleophilaceae bacterium]